MNRDEKIKFLAETCGYSEQLLKGSPDELIDQMYDHENGEGEGGGEGGDVAAGAAAGGPPPGVAANSDDADADDVARNADDADADDVAKNADNNDPATHPESADGKETNAPLSPPPATEEFEDPDPALMSDEERSEYAQKMASKYRRYAHYKHGDTSMATTATPPSGGPAPMTAAAMSELINKQVAKAVGAAIGKIEKGFDGRVKKMESFTEKRVAAEKKATASARLDTLVKAGKVWPAELDAGLLDTVMGLDAESVSKFSEKNAKGQAVVVERTPFDHFFKTLEARPKQFDFSEKVKTPAAGPGSGASSGVGGQEEAEIEKLKGHFEVYKEHFPKGTKVDDLVDGFKKQRKHDATVTAERFLGI